MPTVFEDEIAQGVGVLQADTPIGIWGRGVADTFRAVDIIAPIRSYPITLAEGIGTNDALVKLWYAGGVVSEGIAISQVSTPAFVYGLSLADQIAIAELLQGGRVVAIAEGIAIAPVLTLLQAVTVAERLGIAPVLLASGLFGKTLAERIGLNDSLRNFLSGVIAEGVGVNDALTYLKLASASLSEGVGVNAVLEHQLLIRVDMAEGIAVHLEDLPNMILNGQVTDGIEMAIGYLEPSGAFTAWAVNTLTAGVTEYTNFVFNSFAKIGHKYVGANSTGLYELTGEKDVATSIIADMKSGILQLGGAHLTSFKAAYLGVRGKTATPGEFLLRLISAEGRTYDYKVLANSMQTSRINLGKGLRSRYWSFQLISTGQDFDLESIEFIPLVAQRRV